LTVGLGGSFNNERKVVNMRIILLRILIASWMIPFSWVLIFPIFVLLTGWDEGIDITIELNSDLWNGM